MVCGTPTPPQLSQDDLTFGYFPSDAALSQALLDRGRTSWLSGHYRICSSDLSRKAVRQVAQSVIPNIRDMHQLLAAPRYQSRQYIAFDYKFLTDVGSYSAMVWLEIYKCSNARIAEGLFMRWLLRIHPERVPKPLEGFTLGQYALEEPGGYYWIRDNILIRSTVEDDKLPVGTAAELAKALDNYLLASPRFIVN
ncbi:hypothetical protein ABW19_dt0201738 [Dactylella cylindrospora]|nr:hypothetical protein ABW19_dt0201738 [Dactylella cylindrospora]